MFFRFIHVHRSLSCHCLRCGRLLLEDICTAENMWHECLMLLEMDCCISWNVLPTARFLCKDEKCIYKWNKRYVKKNLNLLETWFYHWYVYWWNWLTEKLFMIPCKMTVAYCFKPFSLYIWLTSYTLQLFNYTR